MEDSGRKQSVAMKCAANHYSSDDTRKKTEALYMFTSAVLFQGHAMNVFSNWLFKWRYFVHT
jgi:hypothetical protein